MKRIPVYIFPPLLVAVIAVCVYYPALQMEYVWDDQALFIYSTKLRDPNVFKDLSLLWNSISSPIISGTSYFRPLTMITFIIEFLTIGVESYLSHAVNLVIYTLNTVMVVFLTYPIVINNKNCNILAFLSGILYALHPALIESTVWVAGRFDVLVTFFILSALVAEHYISQKWRAISIGFLFFSALLSKEMAITFPIILVCYKYAIYKVNDSKINWLEFYIYIRKNKSEHWTLLSLIIALLLYFILRVEAQGTTIYFDHKSISIWNHFLMVIDTFIFYLKMTIWPFADINPMHPYQFEESSIFTIILNIFFGFSFVGFVVWKALKGYIPFILILMWLIALLPVLNMIPLPISGNIGNERFLTLPLVFAVISLVTSISFILEKNKAIFKFLINLIVIIWIILSFANIKITLPLWKSDYSLWSWSYEKYPNNPYVQFSYISGMLKKSDYNGAQKAFDKILNEIGGNPENLNPRVRVVYGAFLGRSGKAEEAEKELSAVINIAINHYRVSDNSFSIPLAELHLMSFAYVALAESQISLKKFHQAQTNAEIAILYQSDYPPAYLSLAMAFYGQSLCDDGDKAYQAGLYRYIDAAKKDAEMIIRHVLKQMETSCKLNEVQN